MTADDIRALEIEVAKAMGYRVEAYNITEMLWTIVAPNGAYWVRPDLMAATAEQVWQKATPRYITDPAATAEVKREIRRRKWSLRLNLEGEAEVSDYPGAFAVIQTAFNEDEVCPRYRASAGYRDHPTEEQAEGLALVRAFLQACRATGATEGEGRKEGESGQV